MQPAFVLKSAARAALFGPAQLLLVINFMLLIAFNKHLHVSGAGMDSALRFVLFFILPWLVWYALHTILILRAYARLESGPWDALEGDNLWRAAKRIGDIFTMILALPVLCGVAILLFLYHDAFAGLPIGVLIFLFLGLLTGLPVFAIFQYLVRLFSLWALRKFVSYMAREPKALRVDDVIQ